MNICVTVFTRTRPVGAETRRNMAKRTSLLGRSRPSEKLTREEIAALDKATVPEPPAKPPWTNGGGPQRMVRKDLLTFPLEPRVPWLRFQGHRQWPAPARATSGEVRPLQSGPRPGWRVMVRVTTAPCSRGNVRDNPKTDILRRKLGEGAHKPPPTSSTSPAIGYRMPLAGPSKSSSAPVWDNGTKPNSSMISRPRRDICLGRFSSLLSSRASINSCTSAAAVVEAHRHPALARGQAQSQGDVGLAGAAVADGNDVLTALDVFATGQFHQAGTCSPRGWPESQRCPGF